MIDATFYMAALNLRGKRALVVGAGPIGLEKIEGLLACDADVTVVAPEAIADVRALADAGTMEWHARPYRTDDLEGCFVAVATTSDREVNTAVWRDAEARSMLVNVADVPDLCNFILPAVHRAGPLAVAISTGGASPALAKRLRDEVAATVGEEYARLALMLDDERRWAKATLPTYAERRDFFEDVVNGNPDPIELLRSDDVDGVRKVIADARRRAQQRSA